MVQSCTCILTFPSSNLILNVENDTPTVGAISLGSISQMYCLMRLLLPTPEKQRRDKKIKLNQCQFHISGINALSIRLH